MVWFRIIPHGIMLGRMLRMEFPQSPKNLLELHIAPICWLREKIINRIVNLMALLTRYRLLELI